MAEPMMVAASVDEESRLEARLKEVEASIQELQKKRAELLRSKETLRWAKTKAQGPSPVQATTTAPAPPAPSSVDLKAVEKTLGELDWSSFKKKEGEWAFLRNRDGSLIDALTKETEFVNELRRGKQLVVGRYRYSVSEDKFLNRYFNA